MIIFCQQCKRESELNKQQIKELLKRRREHPGFKMICSNCLCHSLSIQHYDIIDPETGYKYRSAP